jgi:hypothetical protein
MCSSRCVTLPSNSPATGPWPRVPATMASAPSSRALSAITCAVPCQARNDHEGGVDAFLASFPHLPVDLCLELVRVGRHRVRQGSADEVLVDEDRDELPVFGDRESLREGKRSVRG